MGTTITKTKRTVKRNVSQSRSTKEVKAITQEDIRKRAYEIYLENLDSYNDPLEDWYNAERELREDKE